MFLNKTKDILHIDLSALDIIITSCTKRKITSPSIRYNRPDRLYEEDFPVSFSFYQTIQTYLTVKGLKHRNPGFGQIH